MPKPLFAAGQCRMLLHVGMGLSQTARGMHSVSVLPRNITFDFSSGDAALARAKVSTAFLPTPID